MIRSLFAKLHRIPVTADENYSEDAEPLHETLVSEGQEQDTELDEKKLRRMNLKILKENPLPEKNPL